MMMSERKFFPIMIEIRPDGTMAVWRDEKCSIQTGIKLLHLAEKYLLDEEPSLARLKISFEDTTGSSGQEEFTK